MCAAFFKHKKEIFKSSLNKMHIIIIKIAKNSSKFHENYIQNQIYLI